MANYPTFPTGIPPGTIFTVVYNPTTLAEIGSSTSALTGKSAQKLSAAGNGSLVIPLQLPSAERDLFQTGRLVAAFILIPQYTYWQELTCFKIKKKQTKITTSLKQVIELSGPNMLQELAERKILDRVFSRESPVYFESGSSTTAFTSSYALPNNGYKGWSVRTDDWSNRGVVKSNTNAVITLEEEFTDGEPTWPLFLTIYGAEPFHAQTIAQQILGYAQHAWVLIPVGIDPAYNAIIVTNGESILENLNNLLDQTGHSFRLSSLTAERWIEWVYGNDTPGITLTTPTQAQLQDNLFFFYNGIIDALSETEDFNVVTRIIPFGSGLGDDRLTIKDTTQTLPAGFDWVLNENGHKKGIRNVVLEATGIQVETEVFWAHIKPANQSQEAVPAAVESLVNAAVSYLEKRTTNEKFYSAKCLLGANIKPGQAVNMSVTAQGSNPYIINYTGPDVLYVQSVSYSVKDGIRYTDLKLTETQQGKRDDSASLVADSIKAARGVVRHTNSDPSKGSSGGSGTTTGDHGTLGGLTDDDHPQYLLANGARVLTGDLLVLPGVLVDGVDISELPNVADINALIAQHTADPDAHHTPGTLSVSSTNANNGTETHAIETSNNPGQQAMILATDAQGRLILHQLTITHGLIFTDRTTGQTYNLYVDNGRGYFEPV